ncbi:MAG TPA: PilZ domain-containing protein [Anaeromyxobacteraceae bacterium]|nr:PilZ domain-containing protein [Anaeromyxobacteraceae bacterium]
MTDTRRFSRITFHRPAKLEAGSVTATCEVLDVSLKGALLQVPPSFAGKPGEACTLTIRLDAGEAVIRMGGQIAHREGGHVGVRCSEIDLESITHLRRLVELNVGDDEVLHRELAALVGR